LQSARQRLVQIPTLVQERDLEQDLALALLRLTALRREMVAAPGAMAQIEGREEEMVNRIAATLAFPDLSPSEAPATVA